MSEAGPKMPSVGVGQSVAAIVLQSGISRNLAKSRANQTAKHACSSGPRHLTATHDAPPPSKHGPSTAFPPTAGKLGGQLVAGKRNFGFHLKRCCGAISSGGAGAMMNNNIIDSSTHGSTSATSGGQENAAKRLCRCNNTSPMAHGCDAGPIMTGVSSGEGVRIKPGMHIRVVDDPLFDNGRGNSAHWYYLFEGIVVGERGSRGMKLKNVRLSPQESQTVFDGVKQHCWWLEVQGVPLRPRSGLQKENGRYKVGMWEVVSTS